MFDWLLRFGRRSAGRRSILVRRRLAKQGRPKYRFLPGSVVPRSEIHFSLVLTLFLLSASILGMSYLDPNLAEIRSAAFTLPLIWFVSLVVRAATQQLAIGDYSHDSATMLCPTGNMQTDYEYLPRKAMLAYAVSGQLASLALISIGLVVNATMIQPSGEQLSVVELLDFRGGWGSEAWATQIFWVNLFLFVLNLLPTVPFDSRSLMLCFFCWRNQSTQNPQVFRGLGAFDSHLASLMFGVGLTSIAFGSLFGVEVTGWYASLAAAAYLFVASQWEHSRAEDLEDQFAPSRIGRRVRRGDAEYGSAVHFESDAAAPDMDSVDLLSGEDGIFNPDFDDTLALDAASLSSQRDFGKDDAPENVATDEDASEDIDEILRKLHRSGLDALSDDERQALVSASEQIKERRGSSHDSPTSG